MIPDAGHALQIIMGTLMTDVAPNVRDEYRRANVHLLAVATLLIAQEYDRAAEVRAIENRELRQLFATAATSVADPELQRRLLDAARKRDPGLRVGQLTEANSALRRLLIELHAAVEADAAPAARRLERAIWDLLRRACEGRAIQIG